MDRNHEVSGSLIGTMINPHHGFTDPNPRTSNKTGTGGALSLA